jgi:hypothetical protein
MQSLDISTEEEIDAVIKEIGFGGSLIQRLDWFDAEVVMENCRRRFKRSGPYWGWEKNTPPPASILIEGSGYRHLSSLCAESERIWFIPQDKKKGSPLVFLGAVAAIQMVIGECLPFSYYVVDKTYGWLIGEDNADLMFASGGSAEQRIYRLQSYYDSHTNASKQAA